MKGWKQCGKADSFDIVVGLAWYHTSLITKSLKSFQRMNMIVTYSKETEDCQLFNILNRIRLVSLHNNFDKMFQNRTNLPKKYSSI